MQFIIGLIVAFASLIGLELTKKTAIAVAAIAAFVALTLALASLITGLYTGIAVSVSDSELVAGFGLFIPANAGACVSAVLAAKLARRIYDINVEAVKVLGAA